MIFIPFKDVSTSHAPGKQQKGYTNKAYQTEIEENISTSKTSVKVKDLAQYIIRKKTTSDSFAVEFEVIIIICSYVSFSSDCILYAINFAAIKCYAIYYSKLRIKFRFVPYFGILFVRLPTKQSISIKR